jgi:predicted phosphate transport protein (TIGR00153 family)
MLSGSQQFRDLLENYQDGTDLVARISDIEQRGDEIAHQITSHLPKSFITPIDRAAILRFTSAQDDVVDTLEKVAKLLSIYQVKKIRKPSTRFASIIVQAAQELDFAIKGLRDRRQYHRVREHLTQVNIYKTDSNRLFYETLSDLFAQTKDPFEFLCWKEIFGLLNSTVERIDCAGDVVREILTSNA